MRAFAAFLAIVLTCFAPAAAQFVEWQVNSPEATIHVDGVLAYAYGPPAVGTYCRNSGAVLTVHSTLIHQPYELAIITGPLLSLSSGGFMVGSQVVNVDLRDPNRIYFFNSGTAVPLLMPFPNNYILPFDTGPIVQSASAQMIIADPSRPMGVALSQGSQIDVVSNIPIPGPLQDDECLRINLGVPPLCAIPSVVFCGTTYGSLFVSSNGRILFGGPDIDWSPSLSEAMGGNPFLGLWTDLSPNSGGAITISAYSTIVRAEWTNVPYYAETSAISVAIEMCGACGAIRFDQLDHVVPNPVSSGAYAGDSMFLGLSPGLAGGATNPGRVTFAAGTGGFPAATTDMIFDFWDAPAQGAVPAIVPSLAAGTLHSISFAPTGATYSWAGF